MGRLAKLRYTHDDMIDCIIANPWISQGELAARYGYTEGWVSNIMASDVWRAKLAQRKEEVVDPVLKLTLEERIQGMMLRSLQRLEEKLDAPVVSDNTVLKALDFGAKSLGLGQPKPPAEQDGERLERLAERLVSLQSNVKKGVTYENAEIVSEER